MRCIFTYKGHTSIFHTFLHYLVLSIFHDYAYASQNTATSIINLHQHFTCRFPFFLVTTSCIFVCSEMYESMFGLPFHLKVRWVISNTWKSLPQGALRQNTLLAPQLVGVGSGCGPIQRSSGSSSMSSLLIIMMAWVRGEASQHFFRQMEMRRLIRNTPKMIPMMIRIAAPTRHSNQSPQSWNIDLHPA